MRFGIIMAGGAGERFWPLSRRNKPKQILNLSGETTLLDEAIARLEPIIPKENIFVATSKELKPNILKYSQKVLKDNFICEPIGRNTAPCLGLAAIYLRKRFGDPTMAVMTADHKIQDLDVFMKTINVACDHAEKANDIVVFGIAPSRPEVGYGYVEAAEEVKNDSDLKIYKVKQFREKPNFKLATEFVKKGNFYWNSGMFVWRVSTLLAEFEKSMPEIYEGLLEIEKAIDTPNEDAVLDEVFAKFPKISIDYGIMENADNVCVIKSEFRWDDIGSWNSIERIREKDEKGNIIQGDCIALSTKNSIIYNMAKDKKIVASLGANNLIIVLTDDAVLICDRERDQQVKDIVTELKNRETKEFL